MEHSPKPLALRRHIPLLMLALATTTVVHLGALRTFFAQDDITFLSRAAGLEPPDRLFRPLSLGLVFSAEYNAFGLDPFPYHLIGLVLHLFNVALVYALGFTLSSSALVAGAAAILFGVSISAFTPLHWATGIAEILAGFFLLAATLLWVRAGRRAAGHWLAALTALLAMLSKETAAAWVIVVLILEAQPGRRVSGLRSVVPALVVTGCFSAALLIAGPRHSLDQTGAYAWTASPEFVLRNLFTYVRWATDVTDPIPDALAVADPTAWRFAIPMILVFGILLWKQVLGAALTGLAWWLAFLLPVLPLAHHSYLYYLYIPAAGGAIFFAAASSVVAQRWPQRLRHTVYATVIAAYATIQWHNVFVRETATRDALPVDRSIRDATLTEHCLAGLRRAHLARGTAILFVNPVPGRHLDSGGSAPTAPQVTVNRTSYYPLEAALRGGETLRLFLPNLEYHGFSARVPTWPLSTECLYFEQRGWLRPWGRGQSALMRQAEVQMAAQQWASAESTYQSVRAVADTVAAALHGQFQALSALGNDQSARLVAEAYVRRWPDGPGAFDARDYLARSRVHAH